MTIIFVHQYYHFTGFFFCTCRLQLYRDGRAQTNSWTPSLYTASCNIFRHHFFRVPYSGLLLIWWQPYCALFFMNCTDTFNNFLLFCWTVTINKLSFTRNHSRKFVTLTQELTGIDKFGEEQRSTGTFLNVSELWNIVLSVGRDEQCMIIRVWIL